jgi:hypothetical protein
LPHGDTVGAGADAGFRKGLAGLLWGCSC